MASEQGRAGLGRDDRDAGSGLRAHPRAHGVACRLPRAVRGDPPGVRGHLERPARQRDRGARQARSRLQGARGAPGRHGPVQDR